MTMTSGEENFRALVSMAGDLERIANRLEDTMTQPWKQLLGELREMNQHLKDVGTELYGLRQDVKKLHP